MSEREDNSDFLIQAFLCCESCSVTAIGGIATSHIGLHRAGAKGGPVGPGPPINKLILLITMAFVFNF